MHKTFEEYFDRARTMLLYDVDRKQVYRNLLSEGAPYDIAYFALKGAEMAIREWWINLLKESGFLSWSNYLSTVDTSKNQR